MLRTSCFRCFTSGKGEDQTLVEGDDANFCVNPGNSREERFDDIGLFSNVRTFATSQVQ